VRETGSAADRLDAAIATVLADGLRTADIWSDGYKVVATIRRGARERRALISGRHGFNFDAECSP
jgi:hypothetical protein